MAQPHKGERRLVASRVPEDVYEELIGLANEAGTSVSQFIADRMAIHVGRPDLVWPRRTQEEGFPLAM